MVKINFVDHLANGTCDNALMNVNDVLCYTHTRLCFEGHLIETP